MNVVYDEPYDLKRKLDEIVDGGGRACVVELTPREWQQALNYLGVTTMGGGRVMWYRGQMLTRAWSAEPIA